MVQSSSIPVLLTAIGVIGGIHWGWWKIQKNPNFVDPRDVRPHPFIEAWRYWRSGKYIEKPNKEKAPVTPVN